MKTFSSHPHILHVVDGLAPGGGERVLIEIANATDKVRYRVSVCVTRSDTTLASGLAPEIPVFKLGRTKRFELVKFQMMAKLCNSGQVDLIQAHMQSSFLFICALQAMRFLPDLPVIFLEQNGDVEINNRVPNDIQWALKLFQPYFVGVHEDLTNAAVKAGVCPAKASTISNAIDFIPYQNTSYLPIDDLVGRHLESPVGIMVANIRPTKNHSFLFDALAQIKDEKWTMLLVGGTTDPQYLNACKRQVTELDLESRVLFLGTRTDIPQLLRSVDFGVFSSKSESGPLVLLEYIAAGLPFVSTSVGHVGKSLQQSGIPDFVKTSDLEGFVHAMRKLICLGQEERIQRVDRARDLAASKFDIRAVMPQWHALYEKALARPE